MGLSKSPKERAKAQKKKEQRQASRANQDAATRSEQQASYDRDRRAPDEDNPRPACMPVAYKATRKKQQGAARVAVRAEAQLKAAPPQEVHAAFGRCCTDLTPAACRRASLSKTA